MRGLMMDAQLTIPALLRRAETFSGDVEIVSRRADRGVHRYAYGDMIRRAKQLALALERLGVGRDDRVATLAWNHHEHLESYFGVACAGGVLHTLNPRLHANELSDIINHAEDRFLLVDRSLLPVWERCRPRVDVERVIVMGGDGDLPDGAVGYEALLASSGGGPFEYPELDENDAAAMCYTSGTTGMPKGVVYSHRAIVLQALTWMIADTVGVRQRDVVLPVVPMFHINAWCLPYAAVMVGAKLVFPHRYLDPASLLELVAAERVTLSAGAPAVWLDVLQALEAAPDAVDISSLEKLVIGGSAAPLVLIEGFQERFGVTVLQAWGMTETTSLGTVSGLPSDLRGESAAVQYEWRARQGRPTPFVEIRARGDAGLVPWDDETMGELEVRGPAVASGYFKAPGAGGLTREGWFPTGDIVTINPRGSVRLHDRSRDLIKSGGEWISSVALENALMGHPAVAEAAVIAAPHPKWGERPLACVVLKPGHAATASELRDHLAPAFAKWWLPDAFEFLEQIPRTATGKFLKSALRERFKDYCLPAASLSGPAAT